MTPDLSYLWMIAAFGLVTAVGLFFFRWPGWMGLPLSILAIRFAVDAGIAPISRYQFGIGPLAVEDVTIVGPAEFNEIGSAVAMLALGYGSIAAGMLLVRAFGSRVVAAGQTPQQMSRETALRGYRASFWVFIVGLLINIVAVIYAGTGLDLEEIASTRAAFTNEAAYSSAWFNYAWILRTIMQVGALGMLIFAHRTRKNIASAWGANLLYLGVQPIFGGRTMLIVGGLAMALTYHHGVRKLRAGRLALIVGAVLAGLTYIATVRHNAESLPDAIMMSVTQLGSSRAMEEVAFAQREFPDRVPYFYGSTIVAGLSMALPGLDVGQNLWKTLEEEFIGYRTAAGIGGQTISTTGESYMNFGVAGVILIGLMAGFSFGSVYEWQRRNPTNPFAVLLAAMITVVFIVAIYKKLPTRVSDVPMRMLVPLGFIAAYAAGGRLQRTWLTLAGVVLAGMVVFRLTISPIVKYATLIPIVLIFFYSVYAQVAMTRIDLVRRRIRNEAESRRRKETAGDKEESPEEYLGDVAGPDVEGRTIS